MRLDKFLSITGKATRSETARAVRQHRILINDDVATSAAQNISPEIDAVRYDGNVIMYRPYTYLLLNKPDGYVSATEDAKDATVLDLLPLELLRIRPELFPCGRLDKHTLGLMLITNDGTLAHRLLAPKYHVEKTYRFSVKFSLSPDDISILEAGVPLDGDITAPCRIQMDEASSRRWGFITLHEGRYHQIKRMMEAQHNQIQYLERISFGPLTLSGLSERGTWRYLTDDEIGKLQTATQQKREGEI